MNAWVWSPTAAIAVCLGALALPPALTAQDRAPTGLEAAAALEQVVIEAIAKAEKSVVAIARVRKERPELSRGDDEPRLPPRLPEISDPTDPDFVPSEFGTGVVIDAKGLIVTNYHVLGDTKSADFYVWLARKPYPAKVKAADPWLDLAVLQIEAEGLTPMPLGNARDLKKGQFVIALGNPYAIARDGQPSATWGLVSNLSRKAPSPRTDTRPSERGETLHHWGTLIQTDARLELGSSGGALLNLKGEMVGLTTSLAALAGYEKSGGFAYPVDDDFRKAIDQLKIGRLPEYGFLGVAPRLLAENERRAGRIGAVVEDVVPATPAAKAGLKVGDLITHIDSQPVIDKVDLIRQLSGKPAETLVTIAYERGGSVAKRSEVKVTLSKKQPEVGRPGLAEIVDPGWRGMRVEYATAAPLFREQCRDLDKAGCVGVIEVDRDSPAWKAGFRPGDFVSHVGPMRVSTPREFYEAVGKESGDVKLKLTAIEPAKASRTVPAP
ncbi:MAG: trypsin-like peptidase domain-containing protein [Planctomycetaceae bacterium]|nr:trypsin-like peptidase domain-containing protein [Planctomycetaceae bacterium]